MGCAVEWKKPVDGGSFLLPGEAGDVTRSFRAETSDPTTLMAGLTI